MTLQDFDAYLALLEPAKATYKTWREQNDGEAKKWDAYLAAVRQGLHPPEPVLKTLFGRALLAALRMGLGDGWGDGPWGSP